MNRRLSFVCDDHLAERVEEIAHEYQLAEQEVLRQLVEAGLEEVDR